jgi:membrane-bound lytic murein transglycosylase D
LLPRFSEANLPEIDKKTSELLIKGMAELMEMSSGPDYPVYSDAHYRARLLEMSGEIQYRLTADIKNHIKHRTEKYRSSTERTLGLSEMYFPIFEEYLAHKNIPHHLKYLPIVESNLNAVAKSHAAAVGLWQFISGTGRLYGLKISSYLDERSDTHKASNAAATMLAALYKRYNDWPLALAAYNCGPGRVDKYVKGTTKDFWDIRSMLPRETQMYVPYFMAVAYSYEFHHLHQLKARSLPADLVLTDTIHLSAGYKTLAQLGRKYKISSDTLKRLNPGYIKNYIPSSSTKPILVLPTRIVAKHRNYRAQLARIMSMKTTNPIKCIRRVNSAAELAFYMKAHRCSRQDILFWNGLPSHYTVTKGDIIAIRRYFLPKNKQAPILVKKEVETISVHALKVLAMSQKGTQLTTTPVYLNLNKLKAPSKLSLQKVAAYGSSQASTQPSLLQTKPQLAYQSAIVRDVSRSRSRGRRFRSPNASIPYRKPNNQQRTTPAIQAVKAVRDRSGNTSYDKKESYDNNPVPKSNDEIIKDLDRLSLKIQSKEQAVLKAKKYLRRTAEETAAINELNRVN